MKLELVFSKTNRKSERKGDQRANYCYIIEYCTDYEIIKLLSGERWTWWARSAVSSWRSLGRYWHWRWTSHSVNKATTLHKQGVLARGARSAAACHFFRLRSASYWGSFVLAAALVIFVCLPMLYGFQSSDFSNPEIMLTVAGRSPLRFQSGRPCVR